jgi:uncharacterized membrane protein
MSLALLNSLPLFAAGINDMWYALPLIVAVSLVYSATRHEQMQPILSGAARFGIWIAGFMAVAFVILYLLVSRL